MRKGMLRLCVVVLAVGVAAMLAGCDKVERSKYEMIKLGMNKQTVKEIMKVKPTTETADTVLYIPDPGEGPLRVEFEFDANDKLTKKEWLDKDNL
ncbi:MAG: hypothetical protein GXP25_22580 [Planctomycetes bacterium]|nr:hypothetical protein [Planctomycetota bacterium]